MPAAKKKSASSKAKSAAKKSAAKKPAKRKSSWLRRMWRLLLLLLALYGAHSILMQHVPAYRTRAERILHRKRTSHASRKAEAPTAPPVAESTEPRPTITITAPADLAKTPYDNLSVGVPGDSCDVILDRMGYALGYVEKTEQPAWVSYRLTADEARSKVARRTDNFRSDSDIPTGSATPEDYKGSHYDRGHLAPAADMHFSVQAMDESFYMSNMSPQKAELNRYAWKDLEAWTREAAVKCGEVYVVTGPVFYAGEPTITIGKNEVAVPHAYYKVILDAAPPGKAIGFILPNGRCDQSLANYAVTVDQVERVTGLNFFNKLAPELEGKVERECDFAAWGVKEK